MHKINTSAISFVEIHDFQDMKWLFFDLFLLMLYHLAFKKYLKHKNITASDVKNRFTYR